MKLIITVFMLLSTAAHAAPSISMDKLVEFDTCANQQTCSAFSEKELFAFDQDLLNPETKGRLLEIAKDQALIWGDTILEGDYVAEGDTHLEEVTAIYFQNNLIGYRIRYSETAYYTGSCDYDFENKETLAECTPGAISETLLVTADFKEWDITQNGYADFQD